MSWGTDKIVTKSGALGCQPDKHTLFHRYLGHRGIGGRFFENHLHVHHRHYSEDHIVTEYYLNEEANNTPFFEMDPENETVG